MLSYRIVPIPIGVSSDWTVIHRNKNNVISPSSIYSRHFHGLKLLIIVQTFLNWNAVVASELVKFNYTVANIFSWKRHNLVPLFVSGATSVPHCPQGLADNNTKKAWEHIAYYLLGSSFEVWTAHRLISKCPRQQIWYAPIMECKIPMTWAFLLITNGEVSSFSRR